jgi:hypothetical protein
MTEDPTIQIDLVWFTIAIITLLGAATAGALLVRRASRANGEEVAPTLELVLVVVAALVGIGLLFRALVG